MYNCHPLLDTQAYRDGYAVAFANIQHLREKYSLPIRHWGDPTSKGCYACIGTHARDTNILLLGEPYAVHLDDRWPHYAKVMRQLENYPALDDERVSEVEHQMLSQALPGIIEMATEQERYLWLREWYVQKYYSLEQVEHPLFGMMYPQERAMIDAMPRTTLDVLHSCIEYNRDGYVLPVSGIYWNDFKERLREDLFTFANNTRKERLHGWKKHWHTLPGIGG